MAEEETYVRRSVKDLAAGLNHGQVGRVPITSKPAQPLPNVKPKFVRSQTVEVPTVPTVANGIGNQPAREKPPAPTPRLPPRRPGAKAEPETAAASPSPNRNGNGVASPPTPSLPPRRPADQSSLPARRTSTASAISSTSTSDGAAMPKLPSRRVTNTPSLPERRKSQASVTSTGSNGSRVRAPEYDPSTLPPLPPKRSAQENEGPPPPLPGRNQSKPAGSMPAPALPARSESTPPQQPPRRLPPRDIPAVSERPRPAPATNGAAPPPVPVGTRPDLSKLMATKPKYDPSAQSAPSAASVSPEVVELDPTNFDAVVLRSGKPTLVNFTTPWCKYCVELAPIYDKLAAAYNPSGKLTIAKCNPYDHKAIGSKYGIEGYPTLKWFNGRNDSPEDFYYSRDWDGLTSFVEEKSGVKPYTKSATPSANSAAHQRSASTNAVAAPSNNSACLQCRDFSGPDNHAARFPRETVGSLQQLARDLTAPFPSPTDKARAIFTWMHHNVAYDTVAFFGNNVKPSTPEGVLRSGLAVCEGYASLYANIAMHAGLEAVVVGGHGKGYGYVPLQPGQPVPPEEAGHAWNAVKIDIGGPGGPGQMYWHLLDACWGAGALDNQQYKKGFSPHHFTNSNEEFGRIHFPSNPNQFFRADGRVIPWAEYYLGDAGGEPLQVYGKASGEGLSTSSFLPKQKKISLDPSAHAATKGVIRFQFNRVCEHWKPEVNGKGADYVFLLAVGGAKWIPFDYNGFYFWCDVPVDKLGKRGDTLHIWTLATVNGRDGRGTTKEQYLQKQGRIATTYEGIACWDLV